MVVNITTIHFLYQVVMILGSNVHFNSSDIHYSVFTVYQHFSGLCVLAEVNFWRMPKTDVSCDLFIIIITIIFNNFFRWVLSEYSEAVTTTLIPIDAILPEICAFIIDFLAVLH